MEKQTEINRLSQISNNSIYAKGLGKITAQYCGKIFLKYMKCGSVLELGPAEGIMTEVLFPVYSKDYTVVDGSEKFMNILLNEYPGIKGEMVLFENYNPGRKYNNIILGHVLEHVENPIVILKKCREWLMDNGVILAAVPNKYSIHRQAAVEMKLLDKVDTFSEKDKRHGHRRVFDSKMLIECFIESGFKVIKSGGYWLKPLSDYQIEKDWSEDMIEAFLKLGEQYPQIAGELYVIADNKNIN